MTQPGGAEQGLEHGGPGLDGQAAEHIVQNGKARENAQVLEGAGDAQAGHAVSRHPGQVGVREEDGAGIGFGDPRRDSSEGWSCPRR